MPLVTWSGTEKAQEDQEGTKRARIRPRSFERPFALCSPCADLRPLPAGNAQEPHSSHFGQVCILQSLEVRAICTASGPVSSCDTAANWDGHITRILPIRMHTSAGHRGLRKSPLRRRHSQRERKRTPPPKLTRVCVADAVPRQRQGWHSSAVQTSLVHHRRTVSIPFASLEFSCQERIDTRERRSLECAGPSSEHTGGAPSYSDAGQSSRSCET